MKRVIVIVAFFALGLGVLTVAQPAAADAVVGDGTRASCTEAALEAALARGGLITFNCGPRTQAIAITSEKLITATTIIDGGGLIRLDARGMTRIFRYNRNDADFTLRNIHLMRGHVTGSDGGCINTSGRMLRLENVQFSLCTSDVISGVSPVGGTGGALFSSGPTIISDSTFISNESDFGGGAIYGAANILTINDTRFLFNRTHIHTGGAIEFRGDTLNITGTRFQGNTARSHGGALYVHAESTRDMPIVTIVGGAAVSNNGGRTGGAFSINGAQVTINGTLISENISTGHGHGVYIGGGSLASLADVDFVRNGFDFVPGGGYGGGLAVSHSEVTVRDSYFAHNQAAVGGAFWLNSTYPRGYTSGVFNTRFENNEAGTGGGLFYTDEFGTLTLSGLTFTDNEASFGGAIYIFGSRRRATDEGYVPSTTVNVTDSTFTGNGGDFSRYGGAIFNASILNVSNSLFANNQGGFRGGAIYSGREVVSSSPTLMDPRLSVVNSTFSENAANQGGAINTHCNGEVTHVTFSNNTAAEAGSSVFVTDGCTLLATHTIFQAAGTVENCTGVVNTSGENLQMPDASCGSSLNVDALLIPLGDNGGPTHTHALRPDSPAIDAVETCIVEEDQRHFSRPADGDGDGIALCDSGAYELGGGEIMDMSGSLPVQEFRYAGGQGINVRNGPGPGFDVIGGFQPGGRIGITGQDGDWCSINYQLATAWVLCSLTIPDPPNPNEPPPAQSSCEGFGAASPMDGLSHGVNTFYWFPPAAGADAFRLSLSDRDSGALLASFDIPGAQSNWNADASEAAIGPGIWFAWTIEALADGTVICSDRVELPRETVPPPPPEQPPAPPQSQCGNGIQEPGETPNTCPNGY